MLQERTIHHPSVTIARLAKLMTQTITKNDTHRHLQFLADYFELTEYAFWLQDLPNIIKTIEAVVEKMEKIIQFKKYFIKFMHLAAIPPMLGKASDKVTYRRDLKQYLSMLGYLIACVNKEAYKLLILDTLIALIDPPNCLHPWCVPMAVLRAEVGNSELAEVTAQLAPIIDNRLYPRLVQLMMLVVRSSKQAALRMTEENAIQTIILRIDNHWRDLIGSSPRLHLPKTDSLGHCGDSCTVLWKLLDVVQVKDARDPKTPTIAALWSLDYAIQWTLQQQTRRVYRNELVAIALRLIQIFPGLETTEYYFYERCLAFMTTERYKPYMYDRLDVDFRKLLLASLRLFRTPEQLDLIRNYRAVDYLIGILKNRADHSAQPYKCELLIQILEILPKFVVVGYSDFLWQNGASLLVKKIRHFIMGNYDITILEAIMYCISELMLLKNWKIFGQLKSSFAFEAVHDACVLLLSYNKLIQIEQRCLARAFCIMEAFCTHYQHYPEEESMQLLTTYLKRLIEPKIDDSIQEVNTIICAMDFLRTSIEVNPSMAKDFIRNGGVYLLLDIVYNYTILVRVITLGVLAVLCEKSDCIPYLITWRKRTQTIIPMLLSIFQTQHEYVCQQKINIETRINNDYVNLCEPQAIRSNLTRKQIMLNLRPKIQIIVNAIRIRFRDKMYLANEVYRTYTENFNTDEQIILVFVENFASLQLCDAWVRLAKGLINEGIVPTPSDINLLCDNLEMIRGWQKCLQGVLEKIVKAEMYQEIYDEQHLYNMLKEAKLHDALDALKELRFICMCTERMFQMQKHVCLALKLDAMSADRPECRFHRTHALLAFTEQTNQVTSLESDIIFLNEGEPTPLISPIESEMELFQHYNTKSSKAESLIDNEQLSC